MSFSVMTWNLENPFTPSGPDGQQAYDNKLKALADVIRGSVPDLLAVPEVGDPAAFDDLITQLGSDWAGKLSQRPDQRGIRVGSATPHGLGTLSPIRSRVAAFPSRLSPVQVADDGTSITSIPAIKRGALAITWTSLDGVEVRALTAHLKSKRLTFPGDHFSTDDEGLRARYAVYALD